jgi:hypothetical protein
MGLQLRLGMPRGGPLRAASWLFFRVARSTRMNPDMGASLAPEKQPTDLRRRHHYVRDGALERPQMTPILASA